MIDRSGIHASSITMTENWLTTQILMLQVIQELEIDPNHLLDGRDRGRGLVVEVQSVLEADLEAGHHLVKMMYYIGCLRST